MENTCLECGAPILPKKAYCGNCGAAQSPPGKPKTAPETVLPTKYYGSRGALVTSERVLLSGKPHALADIRSASMGTVPANRKPGMVIATAGGLLLVVSMAGLSLVQLPAFGPLLVFGSLILGFGSYRIIRARDAFVVQIEGAQETVNAMRSTDRAHVEGIIEAINQAVRDRG